MLSDISSSSNPNGELSNKTKKLEGNKGEEQDDEEEEQKQESSDEIYSKGSKTGHEIDVDALEKELLPILKEGFVYKKKQKGVGVRFAGKRSIWQRRYVIMDNCKKAMVYGPSELSAEGRRAIPFEEIYYAFETSSRPDEFEVQLTGDASNGNGSRVFIFRAQDPIDAKKWIKIIRSISKKTIEKEITKRRLSTLCEKKCEKLKNESGLQLEHAHVQTHKEGEEEKEEEEEEEEEEKEEGKAQSKMSHFELEKSNEATEASKMKLRKLTERIIARANKRRAQREKDSKPIHQPRPVPLESPSTRRQQRLREKEIGLRLELEEDFVRPTSYKNKFQQTCLPCFQFLICVKKEPQQEPSSEFY